MQQKRMGRTGLRVSEVCLGTMTFGFQCDRSASFAIMDAAIEAGINFFNTADIYPPFPPSSPLDTTGYTTEEIIGEWLRERRQRQRIILLTKCGFMTGPEPNDRNLSRRHILDGVENSLRRLGTDYIDIYQADKDDPDTPLDETLRAFDDLVRDGKVRYISASDYSAWRLAKALWMSDRLALARYDCIEARYNVLYRDIENELVPLCREEGVGVIVYNPLAGGFLTGKYRRGEEPAEGTRFALQSARIYRARYWYESHFDAVDTFKAFFEPRGQALVQVALAWVLEQPGITAAIVGASRPEQLIESLQATGMKLDDEARAVLDAAWYTLPRRRSGAELPRVAQYSRAAVVENPAPRS